MNEKLNLKERLPAASFSFRGYNTTNLGRTAELLAHPAYGPIVENHLRSASEFTADILKRPVDLVERVRAGRETSDLSTYGEDISLITAVSVAQIELLEMFFDIEYARAKNSFGYSLGEASAVVAGGTFELADLLVAPLSLSHDCVDLAVDVTMGVLFSRGPAVPYQDVERLCVQISQRGEGTIGISSQLAPNAVLLLGQGGALDAFTDVMHDVLPTQAHVRRNSYRWPPLHTPIMWQRNVSNRAAVILERAPGGFTAPLPPVLSGVTGKASYNDYNARDLLARWVDHPQRLWEVICEVLASGVETIVHVGPEPNLIPATVRRLAENVKMQLARRSFGGFSMRAVSRMVRRPWLQNLLAQRTALLRAPFVEHVMLEDWLLAQEIE